VTDRADSNRQAHLTTALNVALAAALVFGIIVLAGGDWIPGSIIVAAAVVGLAKQIPAVRG
jgi:hypothetical protein